jgi:hypothetical protein
VTFTDTLAGEEEMPRGESSMNVPVCDRHLKDGEEVVME